MNVHDFTRERNVEARMTLAAARRGLAAAINDAENGIGHLSCDDPKKNGDLMLRVRYDSGAELAGPAIITDEENMLVSLGGAASMLVRRADGSLPLHVVSVEMLSEDDGPCLDAALAVFDETIEDGGGRRTAMSCAIRAYDERNPGHPIFATTGRSKEW